MHPRTTLFLLGGAALAGAMLWGRRTERAPDGWLRRIQTDRPGLCAFELGGRIGQREIQAMAEDVTAAFDRFDEIDMLIVMPSFAGMTAGGAFDLKGMAASIRALGKVRRYAVVAPPGWAATMIEIGDRLIPVEARSFPLSRLEEARAWVSAGRATA